MLVIEPTVIRSSPGGVNQVKYYPSPPPLLVALHVSLSTIALPRSMHGSDLLVYARGFVHCFAHPFAMALRLYKLSSTCSAFTLTSRPCCLDSNIIDSRARCFANLALASPRATSVRSASTHQPALSAYYLLPSHGAPVRNRHPQQSLSYSHSGLSCPTHVYPAGCLCFPVPPTPSFVSNVYLSVIGTCFEANLM